MCGIAGFHISRKDFGLIHSRKLAGCLLNQIVVRGRDATGAAWTQKNDRKEREVWYSKMAAPAGTFIKKGGLASMPAKSKQAILHTRYATQGHQSNNDNNHPIIVGGIVGVHNGHIVNDRELIQAGGFPRVGQVDSEAAFWMISANKDPKDGLQELRGNAALAWMEVGRPSVLNLARCQGSPLAVAQTKNGSVIFASTKPLLQDALKKSPITEADVFEVPEWTYLQVEEGKIIEWVDIPKPQYKAFVSNWYAQPSLPLVDDHKKMAEFGWR